MCIMIKLTTANNYIFKLSILREGTSKSNVFVYYWFLSVKVYKIKVKEEKKGFIKAALIHK